MIDIAEEDYPAVWATLAALRSIKRDGCTIVPPVMVRVPTRTGQKRVVARTAAWISTFGPISSGHAIRMTCGNQFCIEPAHMAKDFKVAAQYEKAMKKRGEK